jgi:hypothetical protein
MCVTGHAASYCYDDVKKAGNVALLEDMETSGGLLRALQGDQKFLCTL